MGRRDKIELLLYATIICVEKVKTKYKLRRVCGGTLNDLDSNLEILLSKFHFTSARRDANPNRAFQALKQELRDKDNIW
jgi:hypothetical protein